MTRKVCLITGTSSGFGLLTTVALAKKGYLVIATMRDLNKKQNLENLLHQEGLTSQVEIMELDVTNHIAINSIVSQVLKTYKKIDILINNAGYALGSFIEELEMDDLRAQFETNFFGTVALTKAVIPIMRKSGKGTIINISSISGHFGFPALGAYASSKFALEGFSESLRLELLPFGVKVVLIEPGSYQTSIWDKGFENVTVDKSSPYYPYKERMFHLVSQIVKNAKDPNEVVETILKVITLKNPALRYPVGKGIKSHIKLKSILPWSFIERLIKKNLH